MMQNSLPLVLASGSKGRLELLRNAGFIVDKIVSADIDEDSFPREDPKHYAKRVAGDKLKAAAPLVDNCFMITADTTTICRGQIFHKTDDDELIRKYWQIMSGRRQKVYTAIFCAKIIDGNINKVRSRVVTSVTQFRLLTALEIEHFVKSGEGRGKSGACMLQGITSRYIKFISGSFSSIIGLPIYDTTLLLNSIGYNTLKTKE